MMPHLIAPSIVVLTVSIVGENPLQWTLVESSGPALRTHHAMVYDSARGRVVLVGGFDNGLCNDAWEWDGRRWTQQEGCHHVWRC